MGRFLLLLIGVYRRLPLIPRGRCIFVESCSQYVYRRTEEGGFLAGVAAIRERSRQCRPGYRAVFSPTGALAVQLADGNVVPASTLNVRVCVSVGGESVDGESLGAFLAERRTHEERDRPHRRPSL
jgi:uncharacterized protein